MVLQLICNQPTRVRFLPGALSGQTLCSEELMKRYHEEKHIIERRIKQYRNLHAGWLNYNVPNTGDRAAYQPTPGRYRKTLRCGGCTRARCQVCHSDKFPKRTPTRQEQQAWNELDR